MRKNPPRNHFRLPVKDPKTVSQVRIRDRFTHDRGTLTGALELEIEALTAVHVGQGSYDLVGQKMVKQQITRNGEPILPGTSIKGMCRQAHEALTESLAPIDENRANRDQHSRSGVLFGFLGYQGHISFDDACPVKPVKLVILEQSATYPPQKPPGRRFYGAVPADAEQPKQNPIQALPAGVVCRSTLRFHQITWQELGEILTCLGMAKDKEDTFYPKLGGGKFDRFGWVQFTAHRYQLWTGIGIRPLTWHEDRNDVKAFCARAFEATQWEERPPENLVKLRREMKVPKNELGWGVEI